MNRRLIVPVVAVIAALSLAAACNGKSSPHSSSSAAPAATAASSPTPTPTPTPRTTAPAVAAPVNPLTGEGRPNSNPVIAVKIDDTVNGRPQRGIDQADIVYIEEAEGGLSRLVAVFNSSLPTVEAVRSTRASDPELLAQYGPIDYVASGGGGNTLQVLDASPLQSTINDRNGPGFSRDDDREVPYNLTANLVTVSKALKGSKAKSIGWTWSAATSQLAGTASAGQLNTEVGATDVSFSWDGALNRYQRVIDGEVQHAADGAVIATPNVIVQFCTVTPYPGDIDVNGNPSQYTHSVGGGEAVIFRNGREIVGTWSRPTAASGTTFKTTAGVVIPLAPGGAWVVLADKGTPLSVTA